MRFQKSTALLIAFFASQFTLAQDTVKAAQPNCTVKLVKEAGASTIEMDFFSNGKEQCLHMSEPNVQATFKQGTIERHKRGAGPDQ